MTLSGTEIDFAAGERIHTENSFKYHPPEFETLAAQAGFETRRFWTDDQERYSLFLFQTVASP